MTAPAAVIARIIQRETTQRLEKDGTANPAQFFELLQAIRRALIDEAHASEEQIAEFAIRSADAVARDAALTGDEREVSIAAIEDALGFDLQLERGADGLAGEWTARSRNKQ